MLCHSTASPVSLSFSNSRDEKLEDYFRLGAGLLRILQNRLPPRVRMSEQLQFQQSVRRISSRVSGQSTPSARDPCERLCAGEARAQLYPGGLDSSSICSVRCTTQWTKYTGHNGISVSPVLGRAQELKASLSYKRPCLHSPPQYVQSSL